jgi:hypothetical protein
MTDAQYTTLAAAMDRVLPSERGPGAADANTVGFARWTVDFQPTAAEPLAAGVALLDSLAEGMWRRAFAACSPEERDAVLERLHSTPHPTAQRFFATLVRMTITGFLSSPAYRGNRGEIGWRFVGFDPHPLTHRAAPAEAAP